MRELRQCHLEVLDLHLVGKGCPDLLVSDAHKMLLVEVKARGGRLNRAQVVFHTLWQGVPILIAETAEEVLTAMGRLPCKLG